MSLNKSKKAHINCGRVSEGETHWQKGLQTALDLNWKTRKIMKHLTGCVEKRVAVFKKIKC